MSEALTVRADKLRSKRSRVLTSDSVVRLRQFGHSGGGDHPAARKKTRDTLNRLSTLANSWAGSFGFSYDALSRRTSLTRPNNVTTNYTYDNLSRLLSVLHQVGGSTIDGATYNVDNAGNRTAKTDWQANVTSNYGYDQIYELLSATQGGATTESYTYDPVGNRLSSLGLSPYQYNASNELTQTPNTIYAQDANGNTTLKTDSTGSTTYTWDYENRLTSVTLPGTGGTVTFKYDPFGRRIQKSFTQPGNPPTTTVTDYTYDRENMVDELDASGNVIAKYGQGQGIDEPLAMLRSGATSYYQADGLGSVTSLTNGAGTLTQTYTFDSFGKQTASSGSLTNQFRYTAREFDTETGLYYYRARYYDPAAGRFLNEDPMRFRAGPDFYTYVKNKPTKFVDPTGLFTVSLAGVDEILTLSPNQLCNKTTGGACTTLQARLICDCTNCPPKIELRLYGHMYIYSGLWVTLPQGPKDKKVHDQNSAIAHEFYAHIDPAIMSVVPILTALGKSKEACEEGCSTAMDVVPALFGKTLRSTQDQETNQ